MLYRWWDDLHTYNLHADDKHASFYADNWYITRQRTARPCHG
jgi:hypothetical protein